MSAALTINDLTISSEMDRKAMADILGGSYGGYRSTPYECIKTDYDFLGKFEKCGVWYKKFKVCKVYKRVKYKHCHKIVWKPIDYC